MITRQKGSRTLRTPMSAIALSILLAACGSEGTDAPVSGALKSDKPNAGLSTKTPRIPLISAEGVRGEVLLAMFDQHQCHGRDLTRVDSLASAIALDGYDTVHLDASAKLDVSSYTFDMSKWNQPGRKFPTDAPSYVAECTYPDIRSYSNPVKPGSYTFTMESKPEYIFFHTNNYGAVQHGINGSAATYALNVTDTQVTIDGRVQVSQFEDTGHKVARYQQPVAGSYRTHEASYTGNAYSFRRQGLVRFGVLQFMQDGHGNTLRLMLTPGDTSDEARLCTATDSSLVKRQHCVTWQVPANWSWGQELRGGKHYVVDDRSVHSGESGFMYWRKARHVSPEPISENGVRGDVFLAMLEQKPCGAANPIPAPDGSFLSRKLDQLIIDTDLGNYWITPGHPRAGYDNILGCNHHHYATVKPGNHTYQLIHTYFGKVWRPPVPWESLSVRFPVTVTENFVSIAQDFEHERWNENDGTHSKNFRAATPVTVNLDRVLPFDTKRIWHESNPTDPARPEFVKMMLLKDYTDPRVARLCWNVDFSHVKRLQCIHWRVPENWKFGEKLILADQTLVEDRSVYPGESGFAYWRANVPR